MVRKVAKASLSALESPEAELSISLVSDKKITEFNQRYLHRHRPTDVLSFSMREGAFSDINPQLLGDVVISVETAKRQAESKGLSLEEEICVLLIHGILHLFGYDHERSDIKAPVMQKKERDLLLLMEKKSIIPSR